MKNIIVLLMISLVSGNVFSQQASDLFRNDTQITWLGIDFSSVQLTGDFSEFQGAGSNGVEDVKEKYFPAWNLLIVNEATKFDIKGMLQKNSMKNDIDMIMERNKKASTANMSTYNPKIFDEGKIQNIVSSYSLSGKSGIAVLFIAESLNKSNVEAVFHLVAIDMKTKKVLVQERYTEAPAGIGVRNFWAGAIYKIIKNFKKKGYKELRTKYS